MELLPKDFREFHTKKFWNTFFQRRHKVAFEWYGDYDELKDSLRSNVKQTDEILNIGCGNSELSGRMFDAGFTNITNIDFSEVAIREMKKKNVSRKGMRWEVMNMNEMTFPDNSFDVVIDKDALFDEDTPEMTEMVEKTFQEISRVLKPSGVYLCVTLGQDHITRTFFNYWRTKSLLRVTFAETSDPSELQPVVFAVRKVSVPRPPPIWIAGEKFTDVGEAVRSVTEHQEQRATLRRLRKIGEGIVGELSLHSPGNSEPRFVLTVIDQTRWSAGKCAVFLVPQGREHQFLFGAPEGLRQLAHTTSVQRLVVVKLGRRHSFESMESVQRELSPRVKELAPPGVDDIPFLSTDDGLGHRHVIGERDSNLTGHLWVEEVTEGKHLFRRLVFAQNPNLIQSECRLGETKTIDFSFLAFEHQRVMAAALTLQHPEMFSNEKAKRSLVVGLGGGSFPLFLQKSFGWEVEAVEIDSTVAEIAKEFFGLEESPQLRIQIADGLEALRERTKESQLHLIVIDVDSKDLSSGMSCPPESFVQKEMLEIVSQLLLPEGMFLLNCVSRDSELSKSVLATLREVFPEVHELPVSDEDVNKIFAAFPQTRSSPQPLTREEGLLAARMLPDVEGIHWTNILKRFDWPTSIKHKKKPKKNKKKR